MQSLENRSNIAALFGAARQAQCSFAFYESRKLQGQVFRAYEFLASRGHAASMYFLADMLELGFGTRKNISAAARWYLKSAQTGHADAMNSIAHCFLKGLGVKQDYKHAVSWLLRAADRRNSAAYVGLGDCYLKGRGAKKDPAKAFAWYRKAARGAHPLARLQVADMYRQGVGVKQSKRWAMHWYKRTPLPSARYFLGIAQLEAGEYEGAIAELNEAARCGHAGAMRTLSECYAVGRGVEKDARTARQWLEKASSSKRFSDLAWLAGVVAEDIEDALEKDHI